MAATPTADTRSAPRAAPSSDSLDSVIYRTSTMLPAIEQTPPAPSHLRDLMFANLNVQESSLVMCDVIEEKARLAPFVHLHSRGSTVKRERFQTHFYEPPLVAPITVLTGDELTKRIPGEQLGGNSSEEREAYYLMRDMNNLDLSITRTEEYMASEIIFTGSCPIRDFDSDRLIATIEYGQVIPTVVAVPWTDPAAKPLDDLRTAIQAVSANAHALTDSIIFGSEAARLFENADSVKTAYNNLWMRQGELTPQQKELGITTLGTFRGIPLIVNETSYLAKDGSTQYYVPTDRVLVACSSKTGTTNYSGVAQPSDDRTRLGGGHWPSDTFRLVPG